MVVSGAAKMELIELVKAYKGRTFDEEIVGLAQHDSKLLAAQLSAQALASLLRV